MVPRGLNFAWWHLMFICPQNRTCFISPFWHLEFWDGSKIFGKLCAPWLKKNLCTQCRHNKYLFHYIFAARHNWMSVLFVSSFSFILFLFIWHSSVHHYLAYTTEHVTIYQKTQRDSQDPFFVVKSFLVLIVNDIQTKNKRKLLFWRYREK
jgi:hypothetical protein